jgi:formimidoylglutamate deiminase
MSGRKLSFSSALLPEGWRSDVEIEIDTNGHIAAIGHTPKPLNGIAVPAMPNVHSHAHQRLMTGLAEKAGPGSDSFWTWREIMYGFALRLGPDDLEAVAAQLYVEMLKAGFSVVGEFQYLHHAPGGQPYDNIAELSLRCIAGAERAGIAMTILPVLYRYGGFGRQEPQPGQRRFINDADRFLRIYNNLAYCAKGLCRLGVAPHSLRAVDEDIVNAVVAGIVDGPIHIHIAEQVKEVEDCLAWSGRRPVEWLLDHFDISKRWCPIHATHMTEAETERLALSGAVVGLCPTTEANLGDGIFNAASYLQKNGGISIGSDSHITVSPAEDLRQLEYSQRLSNRARNVLAGGPGRSTGRRLYEAALKGGAQATAQPVGALAPGCRADIVVLDPDHPALIGRAGDDILDAWIFSGGNPCVRDVHVGGEAVIEDRRHKREEEIARNFRATVKRLTQ